MDEFDLIARYFKPLATSSGACGLNDDVAALELDTRDGQVVVTTDALVEGVHFLPSATLSDVAFKLTAVNVSDCLAKGALPRAASLVLAIPHDRETDIAAFASGLGRALGLWDCALLGGDTVATAGPLLVALTMHGQCADSHTVVRRSGAKAGDDLWTSGTIGDAGLGLLAARGTLFDGPEPNDWSQMLTEHLLAAYRTPVLPSPEIAQVISTHASASIDISDGLLADADKLAKASGIALRINAEHLGLSDAAQRWRQEQTSDDEALAQLVCSGDDYQLLFAAPVEARSSLERTARLFRIGTCIPGDHARLYAHSKHITPARLGWRHFWQAP